MHDVRLPVLNRADGVGLRRSRTGRWRALVLTLVHVAMVAHILHWAYTGRTVSPVEPSESIETLKTGAVNAGILFFGVSIVATLVFGRFFCGWGCHFIAYQDLCAWLMKKIGIRPQPVRARLLGLVPLAVALYMFVWPVAYRLWRRLGLPPLSNHLTTSEYWATFPGPVIAVLTVLVCGFALVYFLGAKGFCTYGCPYGAVYGLADQLAPGRILVNDNCEMTGHCSQTCTSNVDVAAEVARYGMVVDPGCMKCCDCISVCPNDALHFGFATPPAIQKLLARVKRPAQRPTQQPDTGRRDASPGALSRFEEIGLIVVFTVTFFCWRGLYDVFPLLLSVGLAAAIAFLVLLAGRLLYRPSVSLQQGALKSQGRLGPRGWILLVVTIGAVLATAHGGLVQYDIRAGDRLFDRIGGVPKMWRAGFDPQIDLTSEQRRLRDASQGHFERAGGLSLLDTAIVYSRLASLNLMADNSQAAERAARRAIEVAPDHAPLHHLLAGVLGRQGRLVGSIEALQTCLRLDPDLRQAVADLGLTLVAAGRFDEAIEHYRRDVARHPEGAAAYYHLGSLLVARGEVAGGISRFQRALQIDPALAEAHFMWGGALVSSGDTNQAAEHFAAAIEIRPGYAEAHYNLGVVRFMQRQLDEAYEHVHTALDLDPTDAQAHGFMAELLDHQGRPAEATEYRRRALELSRNPNPTTDAQ
ncbi:MAG: tetratricopeptide repeat protein [Planctomycetes bacterium]|nr:tetratricopeptide repeat protein [Planctomycetota bacterium]